MIGTKTTAILKTADLVERWRWICIYFGQALIIELKARNDASNFGGEKGISVEMLNTLINEIENLHRCIIDPLFYPDLQLNQCAIVCIIPICPHSAIFYWGKALVEDPNITSDLFSNAGSKVGKLNYRAVESLCYYIHTQIVQQQSQIIGNGPQA